MLILINIAFGFVVSGIDNAAHLGGLAAGLFLGALIPPTKVPTMARMWQGTADAGQRHLAKVPMLVLGAGLAVVMAVVVVGLFVGTQQRLG
jgi:hypothetical protein